MICSIRIKFRVYCYARGDDAMRRFGDIMTNEQRYSDCDFDL